LFGILFLFPLFYVLFGRIPKHSFFTLPYFSQDTIVEVKVNDSIDMSGFYSLPDFKFINHHNVNFWRQELFKVIKSLFVIELGIVAFGISEVLADVDVLAVQQAKHTFKHGAGCQYCFVG